MAGRFIHGKNEREAFQLDNFRFNVSTDIRFGKGQLSCLPELIAPYGRKVLLTYGGGSIKRSGLYDQIMGLMKEYQVYELSGIQPNPKIDSVYAGAKICKEQQIDVILAVGGGSTIDCSKAIAAAACFDDDAWELVLHHDKIQAALPIVTVLTLAATGSEMNRGAVISNEKTNEKLAMLSTLLLPKASILDPELTCSVNKAQTAAGSVDILSHLIEQYFSRTNAYVSDRLCEGLMKTVIHYAPTALHEPENYEARAQLMWASSLALNTLCSAGKPVPWSCHPIEHEISAYYDITHGVGLGILTPHWMRHALKKETMDRFAMYAVNVWGCAATETKERLALKGIEETESFLSSLSMPRALAEVGVGDKHFHDMAVHAVSFGNLANAYVPLGVEDVEAILWECSGLL